MPLANVYKPLRRLNKAMPHRAKGLRAARQILLLIASLSLLGAFSPKTNYRIYGLGGDALKNLEARLSELTQRKSLQELSSEQVQKQVTKAIEPFGYFKSSIESELTKKRLIIRIQPGPQLLITSLNIRLEGEGSQNEQIIEALNNIALKQGDPLLTKIYEESKDALLNAAAHEGYLRATFTRSQILIDKKNYTSNITLIFNTGPQYYYGQVEFAPSRLNPALLHKYVPFQYGQPYSTDMIINLNNQLSSSGYFSSVVVKPDITHNQYVPVNIITQPVSRFSYTIGAGYGTDTGIRGRAGLNILPLNQKGHKFNLIAQGSAKENALQAQYLIPGSNPITEQYILSSSVGQLNYDTGRSKSLLLSAGFRHNKPSHQRILSLNGLFDNYNYSYLPKENNFTLFPKLSYTFNKTIDPLFSPSGYDISLYALAAAKGFGSQENLGQASIDAKIAITIDAIRTRFYLHGIEGITGIDDVKHLPFSLALFLGGSDNLKGYNINSIGPGKLFSFGSFEIQKETFDKWYILGFVDVGDVYKPTPRAFKYDAGFGLMWASPVGPIKVGVAQAVNNDFHRMPGTGPKLVINMGPDL